MGALSGRLKNQTGTRKRKVA